MSQSEKTLLVFDLLDGEAKAEVKLRPSGERDSAEKIFFFSGKISFFGKLTPSGAAAHASEGVLPGR